MKGSEANQFEYRRVQPEEWEALRDFRLRALRSDPLAFGSTFAQEAAFPSSRWQDRATRGSQSRDSATWVAIAPNGEWVGMAVIALENGAENLAGLWVDPTVRRRGIGGQLLDRALAWGRATRPLALIRLEVNPSQTVAVRLYESRGFRPTGQRRSLAHTAGEVVAEMTLAPK